MKNFCKKKLKCSKISISNKCCSFKCSVSMSDVKLQKCFLRNIQKHHIRVISEK